MDTHISREDGERINPATEEKQTLLVNAADRSITNNSDDGGAVTLTIASNVAAAGNQGCRSCLIWTAASDVTMKIGTGDADVNDFLLIASTLIPVPVSNLNLLRFYGAANGEKIYILYRN